MHDVVPRFSDTPGTIAWAGGALGHDNASVFGALGLSACEIRQLAERGVI